jgi:hypothetical protein
MKGNGPDHAITTKRASCEPCAASTTSVGRRVSRGRALVASADEARAIRSSEESKAQVARRDVVGFFRTKGEEEGTSVNGRGEVEGVIRKHG